MDNDERRQELLELMRRYCQLGSLLPADLEDADDAALAEAALLFAEIEQTQRAIDTICGHR